MPRLASANIGIITALPKEYVAVCQVLGFKEEIGAAGEGAGRIYAVGSVKANYGGEHVVAVALLADMGNNSAAIRATQMALHCPNVEHILMVGIAGAVPNSEKAEEHVRLGDIVVSDKKGVVQYDFDKESEQLTEHRHPPRPPSSVLLDAVNRLIVEDLRQGQPWEKYIDSAIAELGAGWRRPDDSADCLTKDGSVVSHPLDEQRRLGKPKVWRGPIASANKLLKNPKKRDLLRDRFGIKAVEMEGSGVADATWSFERGFLVVRGTCDYCDPAKGDVWQNYAAVAAAAYTKCVIEALAPSSNLVARPKKVDIKIAHKRTVIEVLFGDLFEQEGIRVIPVSEFFESELGKPVSENSLHGKFMRRCFGERRHEFDNQIDKELSKTSSVAVQKGIGKNKQFPIGTTALVEDGTDRYLAIASAKANVETCKVYTEVSDLWIALRGLWRRAHHECGDMPLNLPLIGSGLSGIGLRTRELLDLIILSVLDQTRIQEITSKIRIVIHPDLYREIDLDDVQRHWEE